MKNGCGLEEISLPVIFDYLDYRSFIRDYYQIKKNISKSFSYQVFANKAGFKSKSFLVHVIDGKSNLSKESVWGVGKAIGLEGDALNYFETLVTFNQATKPQQKTYSLGQLKSFRKAVKARTIVDREYEFYSKWYHNTIREVLTIIEFDNDYEKIAQSICPPITASEAKKSVELLLQLGLIRKTGNKFEQTDKVITTGDEIQSLAISNFHLKNLSLAQEAQDRLPSKDRDISCIVGGMSEECFLNIKKEIQEFRKKVIKIISDDVKKPDKVYHINFQVFPTTRKL